MPSKKRHLLSRVPLYYSSWEVGEFIIISESELELISLVVDMKAILAQRLQHLNYPKSHFK